jgi:hypothetical protein
MLGDCQILHVHGHNMLEQGGSLLTCLNPHIKIMLIIAIASHRIKVGNLSSLSNDMKYGEKDQRKHVD